MKQIQNTLRFHRKQKKLSQQKVAEYLGFKSKDRISRWENGLMYPHILNLRSLAKLYGVHMEDLYPEN